MRMGAKRSVQDERHNALESNAKVWGQGKGGMESKSRIGKKKKGQVAGAAAPLGENDLLAT